MIRVAFTMIGGSQWTGGYNYLLNLVRALVDHAPDDVQPVLFFGNDCGRDLVSPFEAIPGAVVVRLAAFDDAHKGSRFRRAVLTGCDRVAAKIFAAHTIDVVFENAQFYGWRFPFPVLAWIPDFQHRHMRHLFGIKGFWKREIGFIAQILSGRQVMLSSEDARQDCEHFYPLARGRTHVVRFAVPTATAIDLASARAIANHYQLPQDFFFLPNQFWKHKNHECVIQALHILKQKGCEVVVAVSGKQVDPRDAEHFPKIKRFVEAHQLEPNFRLLGLIPHEHIPALLCSCLALINPSTFEGWSTTVEEAKAMGTPMILSSLRVHLEQNPVAQFFDANSPEQLADILAAFKPVQMRERLTQIQTATQRSSVSMQFFAKSFVETLSLCVSQK